MDKIQKMIGAKIRMYRKAKKYTLKELSAKIYKSKSILSKYELGETTIDIATLHEIAKALEVDVRQFLDAGESYASGAHPARFGVFSSQTLCVYMLVRSGAYDLLRGYLTLYDEPDGKISATFYMNVPDFSNYHQCSVVYLGELICHPTNAVIHLVNHSDPADHTVIFAGIHMNTTNACYGMLMQNGYTTSEPGAFKIILSRTPLDEDFLKTELLISKEDFAYIRRTNILGYQAYEVVSKKKLSLQEKERPHSKNG